MAGNGQIVSKGRMGMDTSYPSLAARMSDHSELRSVTRTVSYDAMPRANQRSTWSGSNHRHSSPNIIQQRSDKMRCHAYTLISNDLRRHDERLMQMSVFHSVVRPSGDALYVVHRGALSVRNALPSQAPGIFPQLALSFVSSPVPLTLRTMAV